MTVFLNTHQSKTIIVDGYDDVKPGQTIELDEEGQEEFSYYIERGDLVAQGEDKNADEEDAETDNNEDGSGQETPDEPGDGDEETVEDEAFFEQVKGVKYLNDEHAEKVVTEFDDFEDFKANVTQDWLESELSGIGGSKAEEIDEQLE